MNKKRIIRYRQKRLNKDLFKNIVISFIIISILLLVSLDLKGISQNNKIEDETYTMVHESTIDSQDTIVSSANVPDNKDKYPIHNKWNPDETYLLAKIAMAEAEGESLETKVLVILTVLNRVNSDEFPNTIKGVIFEKNSEGTYQFSCVADGRWNSVEPNLECWEAIQVVSALEYDISEGALFFEACKGETWHSRNLTLVHKSDNTRFYR